MPSPGRDGSRAQAGAPLLTFLDGPVGTELRRRGVPTPLPLWSAAAVRDRPDALSAIHADYAAAGATVHTANTFRTGPWTMAKCGRGADWESWTQRAVQLARRAVPEAQRVAGSIAPLEDCYRPELSPGAGICRREHRKMARALASAGVDLILCETFPQPGEARVALEAALETGLPVWLSLTLGPGGDLMDRETLLATVREAARDGAAAVLLNCSPVSRISELMPDFADLALQVPFGAYANVGREDPVDGWGHEGEAQPGPYAEAAAGWVAAGARIVGGCCGTTPEHLRALVERLG